MTAGSLEWLHIAHRPQPLNSAPNSDHGDTWQVIDPSRNGQEQV